jgi:hypothetical protein
MKWGGKRKGAGRPRGRVAVTGSISMPMRVWELVDFLRGDLPRSTFIRRLIEEQGRDLFVSLAVESKLRKEKK